MMRGICRLPSFLCMRFVQFQYSEDLLSLALYSYEKMHLMGMGKQMKYEELLAQVEDIMDRNAPPVPQMCVTPIGNMLR